MAAMRRIAEALRTKYAWVLHGHEQAAKGIGKMLQIGRRPNL